VESEWLVRFISVLSVISGSVVLYYGVHTYREMTNRMAEDQVGIPWLLVAILAGSLELGAILIPVLFLYGLSQPGETRLAQRLGHRPPPQVGVRLRSSYLPAYLVVRSGSHRWVQSSVKSIVLLFGSERIVS
jgi:hypothetical protein